MTDRHDDEAKRHPVDVQPMGGTSGLSMVSHVLPSQGGKLAMMLPQSRTYGRFPRVGIDGDRASKLDGSVPLPGTPLYLSDPVSSALPVGSLGSIGSLEVRLAQTARDLHRAQRLRYEIFFEEMAARPGPVRRLLRRDYDRYDPICDHLLVFDHDAPTDPHFGGPAIVGTYRLLAQEVAERHGGFYSADEFDIGALVAAHPGKHFLELGRSCVRKPYRSKRTVELLWHGIWSYVVSRNIDVLFGCASLEGTDPEALALPLSFLHHHARAESPWTVRAVHERFERMDRLSAGAFDPKHALRALPPLIKGYLRLGGMVGEGAVIDHQFGTTDVLIVLPVEKISRRYISYYGADASRIAS